MLGEIQEYARLIAEEDFFIWSFSDKVLAVCPFESGIARRSRRRGKRAGRSCRRRGSGMKKAVLVVFVAVIFATLAGCKAEEEIAAIVTPRPEVQTIYVKQHDETRRQLNVTGEGSFLAEPDHAVLFLKTSVTGTEEREAYDLANGKWEEIVKSAGARGIRGQEVEREGIVIEPILQEADPAQKTFAATEGIRITVRDVQRAQLFAEYLEKTEGIDMLGITYGLWDAEEAYRSALSGAIEDAAVKAQTIADGAGMKVGRAVEIKELPRAESGYSYESESTNIVVTARIEVKYDLN